MNITFIPFAFVFALISCNQPASTTPTTESVERVENEVFDFSDPEIDDSYIHLNKTDSVRNALERVLVKGDTILVLTTTTNNCCSGNSITWFEDDKGIQIVNRNAYDDVCDSQCFYHLSFKIYYPKSPTPSIFFGNHEITTN